MATIKDVARQAGLSITTVSRALNDYDDVSEATRARVRAVARTLDYHPNATARSLQRSQANAIGLGIPPVLHRSYDAFWLEFIGGVAETCATRGIDLLVSLTDGPDGDGQRLHRLVRERRVDGMLLCDIRREDERVRYLQQHRFPFVAFGRTAEHHDYPYIDVDGTAGVLAGMRHLLARGHRRIAYLGVDLAFGFSHFRFAGYRQALDEAAIPFDSDLVCHGLTEPDAVAAVDRLLARIARPTAIFAAADFLAVAVARAVRATGLTIPGDLSLVAFDDSVLVRNAEPPLTAVGQPNRRLGEEAAALLLDRIAAPERPPVHTLLAPSLAVRNSTGQAPAASQDMADA